MGAAPSPIAACVSPWWRGGTSTSSVSAAVAVCLDVVDPAHLYLQLAPGSAQPGDTGFFARSWLATFAKENPRMTTARPAKARSEGQWALGDREPINPNEQMKQAGAPLDVRERIQNVYAKAGFDSIDKSDLRG